MPRPGAEQVLGERAEGSRRCRRRSAAPSPATSSRSGTSIQPRWGALRTSRRARARGPARRNRYPTMRASAQLALAPSAIVLGDEPDRLGGRQEMVDLDAAARTTVPSRPTAAISMASTSGFAAIATTRDASRRPVRAARHASREQAAARRTRPIDELGDEVGDRRAVQPVVAVSARATGGPRGARSAGCGRGSRDARPRRRRRGRSSHQRRGSPHPRNGIGCG